MKTKFIKYQNYKEVKYIHFDDDGIRTGEDVLFIDFLADGDEFTYETIGVIVCTQVTKEEAKKIEDHLRSYFNNIVVGYLL